MPLDPIISERLRLNDTTLTSLALANKGIDDVSVKELALALKENTTLTTLNLSNNQINDLGAHALSLSLKENYTLTYLNLFQNPISTFVKEEIAKLIRRNCQLRNDNETRVHTFVFDLNENISILDNKIQPTEIPKNKVQWLYAENNKYSLQSIDFDKVGKWMLFYPQDKINAVWEGIKKGVQEGNLWHAKVSTKDANSSTHSIMIYTKDYTDIEDVIRVLDYLKASGLKPTNTIIRYKTDVQTRAGIYSGGAKRPSIYDSDTIYKQHMTKLHSSGNKRPSDNSSWRSKNEDNKTKMINKFSSGSSNKTDKHESNINKTSRNNIRSNATFWRSSHKVSDIETINTLNSMPSSQATGKKTVRNTSDVSETLIAQETSDFVAYYLALKN